MTQKDFFWLNLRDLPYFRAMLRAVEARFYADFDLSEPTLDVGCGDGHFASIAFDRPIEVGVDPWSSPIRRAAQLGGYRYLVQADGGQMPFPDNYFASAVSNSVLEHIFHVEDVLRETARVLKPGALFLLSVPNPGYLTELSIPGWFRRLGLQQLGRAYTEWFRRMSRVYHDEPLEVWRSWLETRGFFLKNVTKIADNGKIEIKMGYYLGNNYIIAGRTKLFGKGDGTDKRDVQKQGVETIFFCQFDKGGAWSVCCHHYYRPW